VVIALLTVTAGRLSEISATLSQGRNLHNIGIGYRDVIALKQITVSFQLSQTRICCC